MANTLNAATLRLNEFSEQCRLVAYDDRFPGKVLKPGDKVYGTLSIGWGHTGTKPGTNKPLQIGDTCTVAEADAQHVADLAWAQMVVSRHVTVDLNDNQYGALVDFVFNCGIGNFLKYVLPVVNAGRPDLVPPKLRLFVKAGGKVMGGLVTRRALEVNLWNTPGTMAPPVAAESAPTPSTVPDRPTLLARLAAWLRGAGRVPQPVGAVQ